MTKLQSLIAFIKSLSLLIETEYLAFISGKAPDNTEAIHYRFKKIRYHISRSRTYQATMQCNDMITIWLLATYGEEAKDEIMELERLIRVKLKSIERRARVKNGEDILNTIQYA